MATIITKNSSTASSVPTNAQLVQGELAVNVTDKRLFTENASGTVVELGTNPSSLTLSNGTANGLAFLNASKVLTTGSALTFDGSNLGLGVTPSAWRSSEKAFQIGTVGSVSQISGAVKVNGNVYWNSSNQAIYLTNDLASIYVQTSGVHQWFTAPSGTAGNAISFTQAMTLDSSGNLLVGTTDNSITSGPGVKIAPNIGAAVVSTLSTNSNSCSHVYSTGAGAYRFYVGWGGTVYATSTSISAISDATLKENVRDLETGLTEVMALRPRRFDWKNGDAQNVAGFVAQEVEQVLPELVTDYQYSEGVTKKSLKMGDILPTLVNAIQEQQAIINAQAAALEQLKADVAAMKGAAA